MIKLHIALEEGFHEDEVAVHVNGEEIFWQAGVKTRYQIGLADSFETEAPPGPVRVEVRLPQRHLAQSSEFEIETATYIGVSVDQGEIRFRVSPEPFRYA